MEASTSDPWEDEGFGGEDDWAGSESLESDVEDDTEEDELGPGDLDEDEVGSDDDPGP